MISQDPGTGNWLPPGSPVDLVVSRGLAPPPVANPAGLSGSWYDPLLSGEGYEVGVTPVGLFIYYYGQDQSGRRLWLSSSFHEGAIVYGQSITLTLSQGSGTFTDPSDDLEEWGSIIMIFDTCTSGRAQMTGKDGEKRVDILKIVGIGDLDCDL